jgi:hypothetical protein
VKAHSAVRAALPTFDFDAEDFPQHLTAGTLTPDVGACQEALQRRAVDLAMSRAMIFLRDPGTCRIPSLCRPVVNSPEIIADPRSLMIERGRPTFCNAWHRPWTRSSVRSFVYHCAWLPNRPALPVQNLNLHC